MEIRLAEEKDIPRVMEFIKKNWSQNHILANNVNFMKYQHLKENGQFCYVIAQEGDKLYGVEGYIPMNNCLHPDIAGALWKVIPNNYFMLGKEIREYMIKATNARVVCSPGINKDTSGRVLGRYGQFVEKMQQYYRLNNLDTYYIAKIEEKNILEVFSNSEISLEKIKDFAILDADLSEDYLATKIPYKDKAYIKYRYFEHPAYIYDIYKIRKKRIYENYASFIILREINIEGHKIAKIVDFIGEDEDLIGLSEEWDKLLRKNSYEYIDFYNYGISPNILYQSGFLMREEQDKNIIPNYFEPFEKRNVEIYFVSNTLENLHLYRGDGDQDRPSFF